jgi:hypothetical protein
MFVLDIFPAEVLIVLGAWLRRKPLWCEMFIDRNIKLAQWLPALLALILSRNQFLPREVIDLVMSDYLLAAASVCE